MSMDGSGKSMARQQYETLEYQLGHLRDSRKWCIVSAMAPTVIWTLWGAGGAWADGNAVGGLLVLVVGAAVAVGLWFKGKIVSGLALVGAFMFALAGAALPMAVGGWLIIGKLVIVLAFAGVGACYALLKNEMDTAKTEERLEEMGPKVGKRKK